MEQLSKNDEFDNIENLLEQLDDIFVSTKKEFTEYLSKLGLSLEV